MGNSLTSDSHEPTDHQDSIRKAATKAIGKKLKAGGIVSPDEIQKYLKIYETASEAIKLHFPGAGSSTEILGAVADVLKRIGCTNENTLFAQSLCPDEINHEEDDISRLLQVHLGEVFHMGGLAGIPFTGKTGFLAFSHHIPDDGNLFVLFAPHVGISDMGKVGEYSRLGQKHDGKACGAASASSSGGYSHCCSANAAIPLLTDFDPYDYQQQFIIREIHERLDKIKAKKNEQVQNDDEEQTELSFQMYDIVKCFLEKIITLDFHKDNGENINNGRLIILGGIQINMPYPMEDYFLPLLFEIRTNEKPTSYIFEETFGVEGKAIPQPLIKQLSNINTEKKKITDLEHEEVRLKKIELENETIRLEKMIELKHENKSPSKRNSKTDQSPSKRNSKTALTAYNLNDTDEMLSGIISKKPSGRLSVRRQSDPKSTISPIKKDNIEYD